MIVCHCKGISDRDVRALVRDGHAATILDVIESCSASSDCGGCSVAVELIVREEHERARRSVSELAHAV